MSDRHDEEPPTSEPVIRVTAMPADANPNGDIFGGWLMAQMDLAAGSVAAQHAQSRAVTIAADAMSFLRPVFVGDEVSVYGELISVGRSSMNVDVQAWRRARHSSERLKVTEARFKFVAIGDDRRARAVPPLPKADASSPNKDGAE